MQEELDILEGAVRRAGEQVLHLAAHGFETHIKKDRSPVTSADGDVPIQRACQIHSAA